MADYPGEVIEYVRSSSKAMAEAAEVMKDAKRAIDRLNAKASRYDDLIQHMKDCGWSVDEDSQQIIHGSLGLGKTFDNWDDAIISCIEVASL